MKFIYRKWNLFSKRAYEAKRRARSYGAPGSFTRRTIENLYVRQRGKCAICFEYLNGIFEADHKVPLALGGSNERENIQLLCVECNRRKGQKRLAPSH